MIMKNLAVFFFVFSVLNFCQAQSDNILERLQALDNNGKTWYNIDGYSVTSENFDYNFDEKGIDKVLKKHSITKQDVKTKDDSLNFNNIFVQKFKKANDTLTQIDSYYIVENQNKKITVVWFIKVNGNDRAMQRELTTLIIENKIPQENFESNRLGTINFGGRKIDLGNNSCYWTFLNDVQCPYFGEMNWSVHKTLQDAQNSVEIQMFSTKSRKSLKISSEEDVAVDFEGVPTKAHKIVFNVSKIVSALAGGKSLTVYYVAEKVRGNYLSCVMSFWDNDEINPETQLPPLLEKVMKLEH